MPSNDHVLSRNSESTGKQQSGRLDALHVVVTGRATFRDQDIYIQVKMHFPYVKSNILRNLSNILCKPYVLTFTCHSPPTTLPTIPPVGRYCGFGSRTNLFGYWRLIRGQSNRQLIGGVSQRVNIKLGRSIFLSPAVLHPWQADPPLPSLVEI